MSDKITNIVTTRRLALSDIEILQKEGPISLKVVFMGILYKNF